jgi:putative SOS response-associated peptidase YedK
MCGRYAQTADMRELMEQFSVTGTAPESSLPLNWNIAPTSSYQSNSSSNGSSLITSELARGAKPHQGN